MNNVADQKTTQSHLWFQMWDKHLMLLNKIWDLEQTIALPAEQERPEQPATNFHTTFWDQHLLKLNQAWHVSPTLALAPPTSLLGKLLFPLKKLILRWIQPSIDVLVQQQNDLNAQVVQTCNGIVEAVNKDILHTIYKLEVQKEFNARLVQALNGFVEIIDAEFKEFRKEFQELQMMIWTFDRRKEALEIDEVLLNQKLEHVLSILREQTPQISKESEIVPPVQERQDDYAYVLFENLYRGDETTIKQRQRAYLQYFQNCTNVLDLGCGRGEFLELLRERNITGYGVDVNQTMVHYCRKKDLKVEETDVFSHLQSLPDSSLDGIFTAQTVEHYPPKQLARLLQLCFEKLQSQKYLVIETQNPVSLYALAHFYRDMSHEKPVHPDALCYVLKTVGFQDIQIVYASPFSQALLLQELDAMAVSDETLRTQIAILNKNLRQLNDTIYGYLDYAVIAKKIKMF
jgi:SAM-dependent methyltransferase